jgi:DNA-binding NarL/FixJ family response regulator
MERKMKTRKVEKASKARVLIADDHDLFRQILTLSLEEAGMEIVAIASTGRQAVEATLEHKPDCLLLDIAMPEMDGLAALSIIKYLSPDTPVMMVTALADPLYMARAGELGAEGFFTKGVSAKELVDTIQAIRSGKNLSKFSPRRVEPAAPVIPGSHFGKEKALSPTMHDLTNQESLVLSLVAMGLTNPAIESRLHISKNTVKTHMRNIFSKLGVSDRTQAAVWALHNGYGVLSETLN